MLKKSLVMILISLFAISIAKAEDVKFKNFQDSVAYSIGLQIGSNLKMDNLSFDLDLVKQGMYDALYDQEPKLNDMQMQTVMQKFQEELVAKQQEEAEVASNENLKKAEAFLAENKNKEGIKTTESGLQYEVIIKGEGNIPASSDTVEVHYEGKLLDGSIFDSSYERGEPIEFPLDRVIPGWTEGVQLMNEGSKFIFYIHPDLGYGARGAGQNIGPNELLIFTVELLQVKAAQ